MSYSASFGGSSSAAPSRRSARGGSSSNQSSQVEQAIISSSAPINISETETISANGVTGIWANKSETAGVDLSKYQLYNDPNPEIIRKQLAKVKAQQNISIKYLRPPAVKAGNIIIKQQPDTQEPGAPPLVIRVPGRPDPCSVSAGGCGGSGAAGAGAGGNCGPIVIREAPPKTPCPQPEKVITIPGKTIPPPPRKVVIERLPDAPAKPRDILIEKWLPYEEPARRVIFEKAAAAPSAPNPRNVVIEWSSGGVEVEKVVKNLGVVDADPREYRQRYQFNKSLSQLPAEAAEASRSAPASPRQSSGGARLEGDVHALALIDLDREGLSQYRHLVQ